jgi:cytosine/adenosine deaminase-related metal-dependent hydrolase
VILRARLVVPLVAPPIPDGAVLISGKRITAVGTWSSLSDREWKQAFDLGDVALLPGFVNAHCHLDYTDMAGELLPQKQFPDWLKLMITAKSSWSYSNYAESWLHGANMLVRSGTTTVGDIEAVPELLPDVWEGTPLRVLSFVEMLGITSRRTPKAILGEATDRIESLSNSRCATGISPHAPYSTLPELLKASGDAARRRKWRVTTHVAESALEFEMFAQARGVMFDWLQKSKRDMSDCGLGTPVEHLDRCGLLSENLLAVHANYLGPKDAALLGRRKVSVAHCPRSHRYFRHEPFPIRELTRARVNVCLGTDSLASVLKSRRQNAELNMFEEMRAFKESNPSLPPRRIVEMATLNGARALGLKGHAGQLSTNAFADLIAIPFTGRTRRIYDAILRHKGDVSASMIDGQWAITPPEWYDGGGLFERANAND